jgi:hypothetical protein
MVTAAPFGRFVRNPLATNGEKGAFCTLFCRCFRTFLRCQVMPRIGAILGITSLASVVLRAASYYTLKRRTVKSTKKKISQGWAPWMV